MTGDPEEGERMTNDHWDSATAYDRFMGRWSRRLAPKFVDWLNVADGSAWLEIGCGTGALTSAICERANPGSVVAVDTAPEFVEYCTRQLSYESLRVTQGTVDSLPPHQEGYGAVVSSLVLNFLPDTIDSLKKMKLICSPRGSVAACVWDYSKGMELLRFFWDAAVAIDPSATVFDEGVRFPLCQPDALRAAFHQAGLHNIEIAPITIPTIFQSFEDYWSSLSEGTGPAPSYVASLSTSKREALASSLKALTSPNGSGPLTLQASAWAIKSSVKAE